MGVDDKHTPLSSRQDPVQARVNMIRLMLHQGFVPEIFLQLTESVLKNSTDRHLFSMGFLSASNKTVYIYLFTDFDYELKGRYIEDKARKNEIAGTFSIQDSPQATREDKIKAIRTVVSSLGRVPDWRSKDKTEAMAGDAVLSLIDERSENYDHDFTLWLHSQHPLYFVPFTAKRGTWNRIKQWFNRDAKRREHKEIREYIYHHLSYIMDGTAFSLSIALDIPDERFSRVLDTVYSDGNAGF